MRLATFFLATTMLALAGCAAGGDKKDSQPEWVDGVSEQYPRNAYFTGVGIADQLGNARDRARAEVAKIFRVTINERASDMRSFSQSGAASSYEQEIQRNLMTRTDQVLEGVQIADTWQDSMGRIYALAILDRARAAMRLRTDINGLDRAAQSMMQRARSSNDPFLKAKLAMDIVENQRERAALQSMLQAVDATGRGIPPQWSLAELEADLQTTLSRIELKAEGEQPWQDMLAGTLSDVGFTVVESGPFVTRLSVDIVEMPKRGQWFWRRAVAVLDINRGGESLGQHRWEFKESATDVGTVEFRLREAIAKKLDEEVRGAVLDTIRD
ncbi:MAG: LPP20 family lipoprotein [Gammaproteobacteria bacterium]|nr:LPP20 family lipoprotein [Gammaproteobacteria bacterium]